MRLPRFLIHHGHTKNDHGCLPSRHGSPMIIHIHVDSFAVLQCIPARFTAALSFGKPLPRFFAPLQKTCTQKAQPDSHAFQYVYSSADTMNSIYHRPNPLLQCRQIIRPWAFTKPPSPVKRRTRSSIWIIAHRNELCQAPCKADIPAVSPPETRHTLRLCTIRPATYSVCGILFSHNT